MQETTIIVFYYSNFWGIYPNKKTFGVCIIQSVDKKVKKVTSKGLISNVRKEDFSKVIGTQILSNPEKKMDEKYYYVIILSLFMIFIDQLH